MKPTTTTKAIAAAVLVLSMPAAAVAQEESPFLGLSVADLAQTWLLRDCGIEDEPLLEAAVVQHAAELTPIFRIAWEEGPPERLVAETRQQASERFARNRAALRDPESLGLSSEDAERASARTAEDFVARSVQSLEIGYRTQALRGLFLTAGDEGRALVEQVARQQEESALADAARLLLKEGMGATAQ